MGRHHTQRTMPLKIRQACSRIERRQCCLLKRVSIHNCSKFTFFEQLFWDSKKDFFPLRLPFSYLYLSSRASQPSWLGTSSLLSAADCNWWQKERSGLFPKVAVQFYAAMTSWWSEIDFLPSTHFCLTPYNNRPAVQHQLPGFLIVESCQAAFNSAAGRVSHEIYLDFLCLAEDELTFVVGQPEGESVWVCHHGQISLGWIGWDQFNL